MAMLTSVELQHFRNIASQKVKLGPLRVLVGRNGAGKSNFVDGLRFLRDCMLLGLDSAVMQRGGIKAIRQWAPKKPYKCVGIAVEGVDRDSHWRYAIEIGARDEEHHIIREAFMSGEAQSGLLDAVYDIREGEWHSRPKGVMPNLNDRTLVLPLVGGQEPFTDAARALADMDFYSIYPRVLAEPQRPFDTSRLDEEGYNLASVLLRMQRDSPQAMRAVSADLSAIVENIDSIRIRRIGQRLVMEFRHPGPREPHWLEAGQQSDGTLRALGLLVALHQVPVPHLIAVEEPELNLHPGAMGLLCDSFMEASRTTQILLTTHSPDLISRFPADVLLAVESVDGEAHIGPIDEAQREAIAEQLFSAGDLLRLDGGLRRQTTAGRAR